MRGGGGGDGVVLRFAAAAGWQWIFPSPICGIAGICTRGRCCGEAVGLGMLMDFPIDPLNRGEVVMANHELRELGRNLSGQIGSAAPYKEQSSVAAGGGLLKVRSWRPNSCHSRAR